MRRQGTTRSPGAASRSPATSSPPRDPGASTSPGGAFRTLNASPSHDPGGASRSSAGASPSPATAFGSSGAASRDHRPSRAPPRHLDLSDGPRTHEGSDAGSLANSRLFDREEAKRHREIPARIGLVSQFRGEPVVEDLILGRQQKASGEQMSGLGEPEASPIEDALVVEAFDENHQ